VVGSGKIGATAARLFISAGHEVVIANSRGPQSLGSLVVGLGRSVRAGTVGEAARFGEVVLVAVPVRVFGELPAKRFVGKIVIDATNYYPQRDGSITELDRGQTTSSELLARHLAGARVVKGFNTMHFETLASQGRPNAPRKRRLALFIAGDDADAKRVVAGLIESIGFGAVDTGNLRVGGARQQPGSPIYARPMTIPDAETAAATLGARRAEPITQPKATDTPAAAAPTDHRSAALRSVPSLSDSHNST
jgi:8-hydroxy-5-deazaflavin:NADPH oxidoreductase